MNPSLSRERFLKIISQFSSVGPLLIVGDVGIDKYTQGEVHKISPEAPVPVVEVTKEWKKLGLAANVLDNLHALDVRVTICGVSGNDTNAQTLMELLAARELMTEGIIRDESRPTIFKERVTTDIQQICRVDYEKTTFIDGPVETALLNQIDDFNIVHDAVIIEDYSKGTLTKTVLEKTIQMFKEDGRFIAVDPGKKTPPLHYKGATLLKPNLGEALMMMQALGYNHEKSNLKEMAEILMDKLDLEQIVITLGKGGMALASRKEKFQVIPTNTQEIFDVSGAGDTAIALLTLSLLSHATLKEAVLMANIGAGIVVGKPGTATVNIEELQSGLEE